MANNNWMDDAALKDIDKNKLLFLQKLVFETNGLSQNEMMPFLMALASKARASNITFSDNEVSLIISVIKRYSTSAEVEKMDQVLKMSKFMG